MNQSILSECLVYAALLAGGCPPSDGAYALFRASPIDAAMRVYIATFDGQYEGGGNAINCAVVAGLMKSQPGVVVRYWCEPIKGAPLRDR